MASFLLFQDFRVLVRALQKFGAEKTDHLAESRTEAASLSLDQHSQATLPRIIEKIPFQVTNMTFQVTLSFSSFRFMMSL